MAKEGDVLLLGPGAAPPRAPAGFHWVEIRVIFSDTGGATEWQLVKNAPDLGELQQTFNQGLQDFLAFLQRAGIQPGQIPGLGGSASAVRPSRALVMTAPTGTTQIWSADANYYITGWFLMGNGGNAWSLAFDATPAASRYGIGTADISLDVIVGGPAIGTAVPIVSPAGINLPFFLGSKLYFSNGTANTQHINVFMSRA
jgi:hypothetical protein